MLSFKKELIIILLASLLLFHKSLYAAVYFEYGAESGVCDGSELPNPPFWTREVAKRGNVSCDSSPEGNKHFVFPTVDNQDGHFTEIHNTQNLPVNNVNGRTIYLAWYFNFTRINGRDIWHETGSSGDKGLEIVGNGIRWVVGRGHWGSSTMTNLDHHYTIFGGNPSYHLNRNLEISDTYVQNAGGYNINNTLQLPYDTWHAAVMAVKIAPDNTGSFTVYVNGQKIIEYLNIRTSANDNPNIHDIYLGGTIAQGAYDAPAHLRKFDALILTDDWNEIVSRGYVKASPKPPTVFPPTTN